MSNDWLGSLTGGLLGGASSALSGFMSYKSAKKLQQHQYDLNQQSLKESPLSSRQGFTSAGYNPLLALGASNQGFSANSAGISTDIGAGVESGLNSAIALKQNRATVDNIKADTKLKGQQGETEKARRVQMDFQNAMYDVQKHLAEKDLSTYDRRFYSNLYEQFQRAENYRAQSAIGMMNAETNRMNYKVNSANAATNARNADINRYKAQTERYKSSGSAFGFGWSGYSEPNTSKLNVRTDSRSEHGYWN